MSGKHDDNIDADADEDDDVDEIDKDKDLLVDTLSHQVRPV